MTLNGLSNKTGNECVNMAKTRALRVAGTTFEIALLCAHATDKKTVGSMSQNEFGRKAEMSSGLISDIMKAFKVVVDEDKLAFFEENAKLFKYNDIGRKYAKFKAEVFSDIDVTEFVQLGRAEVDARIKAYTDSLKTDNEGSEGEGETSEDTVVEVELITVTDERGNKYSVPANILAQYVVAQ